MNAEFLSRADCPLCEDWWQRVAEWPVQVYYRDIDTDAELQARFRWRIPVLKLEDGREFDLALAGEPDRCLQELLDTASRAHQL